MRISFLGFIAAFLIAGAAPAAIASQPTKPVAPAISQALQLRLWRSQARFDAAQLALERSVLEKRLEAARKDLKSAMEQWRDVCGAGFRPAMAAGQPACAPASKSPSQRPQSKPKK